MKQLVIHSDLYSNRHDFIRMVVGGILILSLSGCNFWRVATTVNRPSKDWTPAQVSRYVSKFSHTGLLVPQEAANVLLFMTGPPGEPQIYNSEGSLFKMPPSDQCIDKHYFIHLFDALAEGLYGPDDFKTFIELRSTSVGQDGVSFSEPFNLDVRLERITERLDAGLSSAIPRNEPHRFQVIIPFMMSGHRRLQTILIREHLTALRRSGAQEFYDTWLLYIPAKFTTVRR